MLRESATGWDQRFRALELRGEPAPIGTWRGVAWSLLIAVGFFQISHPRYLLPNFRWSMFILIVLTGILLAIDRRNVRLPRVPWAVVVYLALAAVSVLWSITPGDTVRMVLLYGWLALFACICVAQTDLQTLLRGVAWGGVLVVLGTAIAIAVNPTFFGRALFFRGPLLGLHGHRNIVAYSLVLALTAALMRKPTRTRSWVESGVTLAAIAVGIVLSHAVTGQIGAIGVFASWVAVQILRRLRGRNLVLGWMVVLALVATGAVAAILNRARITALFGRTPDLTDRFSIWQVIYQQWLEAPIGGYGFGAVWSYSWWPLHGSRILNQMVEMREGWLENRFPHGHNLFMDLLPQLGALGIAAAMLLLGLMAVRGVAGLTTSEAGGWALLTLVALLTMGIAEPMLTVPVGWFCVVAATAAAAPVHRRPILRS